MTKTNHGSGKNSFLECTKGSRLISEGPLAKWHAIYTMPRHEKRISEHLNLRQIEHFLPLYRVQSKWKDGSKVDIQLPLFPGYLFVHIVREQRTGVLNLPGVLRILHGVGHEPPSLDSTEIESLRDGLHLRHARPHPLLIAGERVRIRSGALTGMEGIVIRTKSLFRVVITLKLLMQSIAVEIAGDDLELMAPSPHTMSFADGRRDQIALFNTAAYQR